MNSLAGPIFVLSTLVASTLGQTTRNYNCARQPTICTNICYYQTCVQPGNDLFNYDPNGDADQKREDSGVTPNPSSRERPCLGLVDGGPGMETDEFPFASMAEGGDGATLICASGAEQRSQGGVLRQLYRPLNGNGEHAYCDQGATTATGCNGKEFPGFRFFQDDGIYCQWDIDIPQDEQIVCVNADDGSLVDPPAKLRLRVGEAPREMNWTNLLHVRDPELVKRLAAEEPVSIPFEG
ncbi:hypothetical protein AA0114_g8921 [Alternaria tenuissima]|uniref:Deoxyribonuclease NucA/NucB domain-containing protein n=1 Tax=Alternaria tenuissima TaxID=119927 RepID=A0A4Q4RAC2_9PLEO|nr:hypothetical protein AA0114_g8921 [Alternaria tenuissima]RYO53370.1 hypothetical protein AA0116_g10921 [Alternaria tenuissima]